MGADFSIEATTQGLARCDKNVMTHILGQPAAEIKEIYQRFETKRIAAAEIGAEEDTSPHAILENSKDFAQLFGSSDRAIEHWAVLFNILDTAENGKVDFFEAIATLTVTSRASALTKCRMLFQIFDFDCDQAMHRAELLLMLRATVEGISKISHQKAPPVQLIEQLVSQAFSSTSSSIQRNSSLTYTELSHWMRSNKTVKLFLAAVSPSAIHHARMKPRTVKRISAHHGGSQTRKSNRESRDYLQRSPLQRKHSLHIAAELHRQHVQAYLSECRSLRIMFDEMDEDGSGDIDMHEFIKELPAHLKDQGPSMFRALANGRYLHFRQLLHECFPRVTHDEIDMMMAATRKPQAPPQEPKELTAQQNAEMCAIFDMYDTDHSGTMSVSELTAAMTATGVFSRKECEEYFRNSLHAPSSELSRADFVHFFQDGFIANEEDPLFQVHIDDLTPLSDIKVHQSRSTISEKRHAGLNTA